MMKSPGSQVRRCSVSTTRASIEPDFGEGGGETVELGIMSGGAAAIANLVSFSIAKPIDPARYVRHEAERARASTHNRRQRNREPFRQRTRFENGYLRKFAR